MKVKTLGIAVLAAMMVTFFMVHIMQMRENELKQQIHNLEELNRSLQEAKIQLVLQLDNNMASMQQEREQKSKSENQLKDNLNKCSKDKLEITRQRDQFKQEMDRLLADLSTVGQDLTYWKDASENLQEYVVSLKREKDALRQERDIFRIERDQLKQTLSKQQKNPDSA
mmetsp:Transcript_13983/g.19444  ORF Transcript_13983/g.19444 Transcript_13983/m.19444 type:complete len:169 (+) Transcript_13983:118-624(+)